MSRIDEATILRVAALLAEAAGPSRVILFCQHRSGTVGTPPA